jgi:uncharacterized protein YkwD
MGSSRRTRDVGAGRAIIACALAAAALALAAQDTAARRRADSATSQTETAPKLVQKPPPRISPERLGKAIHALINGERAAKGLKPLAWDGKLAAIARGHSADMADRRYFSHDTPEGSGLGTRYEKARYKCVIPIGDVIHGGAENIARDDLYAKITTLGDKKYYDWYSEDELARNAVAGWMKSPGHRANILTAYWGRQGIGVVVTRDFQVYLTEDFC